jgi:hypothetical protein
MFRFERFGNGVLAAEPFAEVNQLAAVRAERPVFAREPVAGFLAGRAFDVPHDYWLAMSGGFFPSSEM